jgi:hypothetical protein
VILGTTIAFRTGTSLTGIFLSQIFDRTITIFGVIETLETLHN